MINILVKLTLFYQFIPNEKINLGLCCIKVNELSNFHSLVVQLQRENTQMNYTVYNSLQMLTRISIARILKNREVSWYGNGTLMYFKHYYTIVEYGRWYDSKLKQKRKITKWSIKFVYKSS